MKRAEMDEIARRDQQIDNAEERGVEKGVEKTARNLLKEGCEIELIIKVTGLSKEQIEKLRKD